MTRKATLALAAAAIVVFPWNIAAESPTVPERLLVVQYIALGIDLGDRVVAAEELIRDGWRATPREREALDAIRQRLEGWDRYSVVNRRANAQLLLVVRQGRRGSVGAGIGVGSGGSIPPPQGGGVQRAYGGAFSSRDDMLAVYDTGGSSSTTLWRMAEPDGLTGKIPLFEAFRADVEGAAAKRKQP